MKKLFLLLLFPSICWSANCNMSYSALNGGLYNTFSYTPTQSSISVNVTCNKTSPVTLKISSGVSGTFSTRTLITGRSSLNYNLYMDSGRTVIFGDGTSGTSYYSGNNGSIPIFLNIPARQNVISGNYVDYLTMTLSY
jgi:spore coat protein U-like protein